MMATRHPESSDRGSALIIVLAMVVIMTALVIVVFIAVTGERRAAGSKLQSLSAAHLASSAPQFVISQIRDATTSGNTWASQPGMLRTFAGGGSAAGVYKLYSAGRMFAAGASFVEAEDAPPADWSAGLNGGLYCDINRPIADALGGLHYPVVDPAPAATSFSGVGAIPGFQRDQSATPGFDSGKAASPANNPLPMPVRWLYILADGSMVTPLSVAADGKVSFPTDATMPSKDNPVVGRLAFWADDETCKINVNTAGYAKNSAVEWTFWDTPVGYTKDENTWLSWAQPWTHEYQRYPGHPATTGLNVVFDSLSLTANQTLSLTPRYRDGGTKEGTVSVTTPPTAAQIAALLKNDRLFASVDEMFYNPTRGLNAAGIPMKDLEARRFLLTANSRAPEVTLWNTPRATIWPMWKDATKRTPIDRLIAFTSTLAGQPFYFVRTDPLSTRELLDIPQNLALWNSLKSLSRQPVPGFGGDFEAKYGAGNRDQILTSIHDAIRLANLDDRSSPGVGATSGWSFTAGELRPSGGSWSPYPGSRDYQAGYVAPTDGPGGTRGAGRTSALAEVAFLFARPSDSTTPDANGIREIDKVKAAVLYGFYAPAAGFVYPAQNRRIRVTGLGSFTVRKKTPAAQPDPADPAQQLFVNDVYDRTELDTCTPQNMSCRRELGGRIEWTVSQQFNPPGMSTYGPPTADVVLPIDAANPNNNPFYFSGGTLTVEVYSPATAPTPYQTYRITFPTASALTPMPAVDYGTKTCSSWTTGGRWMPLDTIGGNQVPDLWEGGLSRDADTVLAMQSRTGDFRSEVLRKDVSDFQPHYRYGKTDIISYPSAWNSYWPAGSSNYLSRRASSLRWAYIGGGNTFDLPSDPGVFPQLFGQLINGFSGYASLDSPVVPSGYFPRSIQEVFPPGDFSSGPGPAGDGSLSPKTDEGGQVEKAPGVPLAAYESPYFRYTSEGNREIAEGTLSSPNRQMPSAIYFGSIPTGIPWRTLLFRPARTYHMGGVGHFGATSPADYLMLDWFHMPVVEPYAISEPFSTAGKINLNARIMPFGDYVRRETALHALLRSSRVTAVPENIVGDLGYSGNSVNWVLKNGVWVGEPPVAATRYPIDVEETLGLLRKRFDETDGSGKRVYLTNAEICSIDLVPQGFTASNLASFWADKRTTGDNLREGAYATLLPRLTAKSNTFTVHVTAQALQTTETDGGWREGRGGVPAEWRGSFGVERYIDPSDARFQGASAPNFLSGTVSIETYYKFRILGERRFLP